MTKGTSCNGRFQKREWGAGKGKIKWGIEKDKLISFFFFVQYLFFCLICGKENFQRRLIHFISKQAIRYIKYAEIDERAI